MWGPWQGIDKSIARTRVPEMGFDEAYNVVLTDGQIKPRPGLAAVSSARLPNNDVGDPISLFTYFLNRQYNTFFAYRCQSDFAAGTLDVSYHNTLAWVPLITGIGTSRDTPPAFTQFKDEAIFVPGDGEMYFWDPNSFSLNTIDSVQADTDLRPPDKTRFLAATGSRVFAANGIVPGGSERISNRVWWCTTGNSRIWSNGTGKTEAGSASYQDLQQDTYPITGLFFHSGQQLIVYKNWSVYFAQFRGSPVWYDFVPITRGIGCVSSRSIVEWRDKSLFLGSDYNVYMISLQGQIQAVGDRIQNYLASIIDPAKANRSVGVIDPINNQYWLFIPTAVHAGEFGRHIFCLNLETGAWTEGEIADIGAEILGSFQWRSFSEAPVIFLGGDDGYVYEWNFTTPMTDRATTWEARVWSKVYDFTEVFKGAGDTAQLHKMALSADSGKATPRFRTAQNLDKLDSEAIVTLDTIDHALDRTPGYVSSRTYADRFGQWGILWAAGLASPMAVQGVMVWALPRGDTR